MESFELNEFYGVNCEDECSNITPEQLETLKPRLKRGKAREVVVARLPPEDEARWYEAIKAVTERHKDELQSLADK